MIALSFSTSKRVHLLGGSPDFPLSVWQPQSNTANPGSSDGNLNNPGQHKIPPTYLVNYILD